MNIKNNKKIPYCNNCGKYAHYYKECLYPITSYGIICFKRTKNNIKFLMIKRRNSICYVEFMRGKYNVNDTKYLELLFSRMTQDERTMILNNTFDELWKKLWIMNLKYYKNEYKKAKFQFETLKMKETLIDLINSTKCEYKDAEWGFPKGRRNAKETDLRCALREFTEETGVSEKSHVLATKIMPVCESYLGSNNIKYRCIYYVSEYKSKNNVFINTNNSNQIREIGDIGWYSLGECKNMIRDYYTHKKEMIHKVFNLIQKFYFKN